MNIKNLKDIYELSYFFASIYKTKESEIIEVEGIITKNKELALRLKDKVFSICFIFPEISLDSLDLGINRKEITLKNVEENIEENENYGENDYEDDYSKENNYKESEKIEIKVISTDKEIKEVVKKEIKKEIIEKETIYIEVKLESTNYIFKKWSFISKDLRYQNKYLAFLSNRINIISETVFKNYYGRQFKLLTLKG